MTTNQKSLRTSKRFNTSRTYYYFEDKINSQVTIISLTN